MFTEFQLFGSSGEYYVAQFFKQMGLGVVVPPDFNNPIDLYVEGVPVHVKAARRKNHFSRAGCFRSRWYFRFTTIDFSKPSLIVCLVLPSTSEHFHFIPFFIPSWEAKKTLSITSDPLYYSGWASRFLWRVNSLYEVKNRLPSCFFPIRSYDKLSLVRQQVKYV